MTIGLGVEGPSDKEFLNKVLHKAFPGFRFDIRNMKNRPKLIAATPQLVQQFRNLKYAKCLIVLDRDSDPCISSVIESFEAAVAAEAKKSLDQRYVQVIVAIKELEAWFLADAPAINATLPDADYSGVDNADVIGAEGLLRTLWKQQYGIGSPNKIDFAKAIAPKFDPLRARLHSPSFAFFWDRLSRLIT